MFKISVISDQIFSYNPDLRCYSSKADKWKFEIPKKNVESEEYATYGKSYEMNRINTNEGQPSSATCRMSIPLFVIVICTLIMFYKRQPIRELADTDFASVQNFVKLGLHLKKCYDMINSRDLRNSGFSRW